MYTETTLSFEKRIAVPTGKSCILKDKEIVFHYKKMMKNCYLHFWCIFIIGFRYDTIDISHKSFFVGALQGKALTFQRRWTTNLQQPRRLFSSSTSHVSTESSSGRTNSSISTTKIRSLPARSLPRHPTNEEVNQVLVRAEKMLSNIESSAEKTNTSAMDQNNSKTNVCKKFIQKEKVFSNSYVDFSKIELIGFDFDYTLVTYTNDLLSTIYDMALERLVRERQYPSDLQETLTGKFDGNFSIRGLAVDKETGWIAHLSYTHKVAVAWEGREKVSSERLLQEYSDKRKLRPDERKKRLKPLNDLFSMAECCLIADTVQFFKERNIPFFPRSCVEDILAVIRDTHLSGNFHRTVASHPEKYFEPKPHLASVLQKLKDSGKKLIFVSNSPFWYVDAGMRYVIGPDWRTSWDVVIVSAGKPSFYTDNAKPFREVSSRTGRVKFKKIDQLEYGEVYTEGCLRELTRCLSWDSSPENSKTSVNNRLQVLTNAGGYSLASPKVLYIGDSLFADLVDAKREFGWTTAAVTPEVNAELELQSSSRYVMTQQIIELLTHTLRRVQDTLGNGLRSKEDLDLLDDIENLASQWRDEQTAILGNPFGSVFRARFQPSLFAHSLRRYCDLYMSSVESLRYYSPQHRFYPDDARLLGHEIQVEDECWDWI